MKSVIIPTETGHIPLLLHFHLFNALRGRRKEGGGRLRFTVCLSPEVSHVSLEFYRPHSYPCGMKARRGEERRDGLLGGCGTPTIGPYGRKSKVH
jgi:hypothetical protein